MPKLRSCNSGMILVTGGAGYIGSHTVLQLERAGYKVLILDNLVHGHKDLVYSALSSELIVGDISDKVLLENIFRTYQIDAVIHFAAYAYVGESSIYPAKYYHNNVAGTLTLLEAMLANNVTKLVFSSTCATYGLPQVLPICENHPQQPINTYGGTKLIVEKMLQDFFTAYNFQSVIFRYFNAAGADPTGGLGEDHQPEPHLIPSILLSALGQSSSVSIFGTDYPTRDGTCVRDYIHVCDLAKAHILGLETLLKGQDGNIFNLSNGNGFSVREIIETAQRVTGKSIKTHVCDRRPGDPHTLIGDSSKARELLGWEPDYPELETILAHAWQWHCKRHSPVLTSAA